jgi:hypothetical protein
LFLFIPTACLTLFIFERELPELVSIHANPLHVQVEKSSLQLLPAGQHVEKALKILTVKTKLVSRKREIYSISLIVSQNFEVLPNSFYSIYILLYFTFNSAFDNLKRFHYVRVSSTVTYQTLSEIFYVLQRTFSISCVNNFVLRFNSSGSTLDQFLLFLTVHSP